MPAGLTTKKSIKRTLKLSEITKRLPSEESDRQMVNAFVRILKSERSSVVGGIADVRNKIITALASNHPTVLSPSLLAHIVEDLPKRIELALAWLYEEYCCCHSFYKVRIEKNEIFFLAFITVCHSMVMTVFGGRANNENLPVSAKLAQEDLSSRCALCHC